MPAEPPRGQPAPRLADDPDAPARAELALLLLEGARRLLREREAPPAPPPPPTASPAPLTEAEVRKRPRYRPGRRRPT